ncbi:hypothetical protein QUF87_19660 [Lysinibacillus pakistanensis]|nr:hypothetical protein [Lysinibacillus pakistanensis]
MIRSRHRIHKQQACESNDVNASERQVIQVKINVKEWLAKEPVDRFMAIYKAARQNDATLKKGIKKAYKHWHASKRLSNIN